MVWFCFFCYLSYIIEYYTIDDLKKHANNYLFRIGSKITWWISKCIWCITTVLIFYAFLLICILTFVLCFGDISTPFHPELMAAYNECNLTYECETDFWLFSVILPLVTTIMLSLAQICVSIYIKPIFCYIFALAYLLCSSYYSHPLLLYNYTMICRNEKLQQSCYIVLIMVGGAHFYPFRMQIYQSQRYNIN